MDDGIEKKKAKGKNKYIKSVESNLKTMKIQYLKIKPY